MLAAFTAGAKTPSGGVRAKRNHKIPAAPPPAAAGLCAQRNPAGCDEFSLRTLAQLPAATEQPLKRSQANVSYAGGGVGMGREKEIKQLGARRKDGVLCERRGNACEKFSNWHKGTFGNKNGPGDHSRATLTPLVMLPLYHRNARGKLPAPKSKALPGFPRGLRYLCLIEIMPLAQASPA